MVKLLSQSLSVFICLTLSVQLAGLENPVSILDEKSPQFPMGKATRRGLLIQIPDHPEMSLSLGARLQGTVEAKESLGDWTSDFYARRIRFEVGANFSKRFFLYMDLRNDQANQGDSGERGMVIGNAYFQLKELFGIPFLNFQGFRGKIDVSRVTTASSGQQIYYDRPLIAQSAQQFVSTNRRAPNLQLFGSYLGKIRYQLAVGDSVSSSSLLDARGSSASSVTRANPTFGGKIILSPIPGWEEKERTMTYFGQGQHASVGVGYFQANSILFKSTGSASESRLNRSLLNIETSFAWGPLFLCAEYLKFTGVSENFQASSLANGTSDGWYVTGEYVFSHLSYFAPFFKYERWNRFREASGYLVESTAVGANWYLMGNSFRWGIVGQRDSLGTALGGRTDTLIRLVSQVYF